MASHIHTLWMLQYCSFQTADVVYLHYNHPTLASCWYIQHHPLTKKVTVMPQKESKTFLIRHTKSVMQPTAQSQSQLWVKSTVTCYKKITTFRKLDIFPSSDKGWTGTCFAAFDRKKGSRSLGQVTEQNVLSNFFYSCSDLLLLWAQNFYTIWRLCGTLKKFFCNMHNKNIYNKNLKISTAWQQFTVHGNISITAHPRSVEEALLRPQIRCSDWQQHFFQTQVAFSDWEQLSLSLPTQRFLTISPDAGGSSIFRNFVLSSDSLFAATSLTHVTINSYALARQHLFDPLQTVLR
jgi:hypothetical protein